MDLNSRALALSLAILGGLVIAIGAALVYLPAGIIVAGSGLLLLGLTAIDIDGDEL